METKNIYQRINQVHLEVQSVFKDGEIKQGGGTYSVVTHDAVTKTLHGPMAKAGIIVIPNQKETIFSEFEKTTQYNGQTNTTKVYRVDVVTEMTFINMDKPEDRFTTTVRTYAMDSGDKAVGKAFSMGVKMILLKVFMLESVDEEESREIEGNAKYNQRPVPNPLKKDPPPPKSNLANQKLPEDSKEIKNEAPISAQQAKDLADVVQQKKMKIDDIKKIMKEKYNVEMSQQLKVWQFLELIKSL